MIGPFSRAADRQAGEGAEHQQGQRLLSASVGVRGPVSPLCAASTNCISTLRSRASRMLRDLLNAEGRRNRPPSCRYVMKRMGIEAIYRKAEHE